MPPIPPNPVQSKSKIVTSSDLLNSVVLEADGFMSIGGKSISNALWNGAVKMQIQNDDLSWSDVFTFQNPNEVNAILGDTINGTTGILLGSGTEKFPFNVRFIVSIHATLGQLQIEVSYI